MRYLFLRYPEGKTKAVTLSYDDGPAADRKMLEILNRYGVKCTFNFNEKQALTTEETETLLLGRGHEIAVHGAEHRAPGCQFPVDGIQDVLDGRRALERQFRRVIRGMAYPDSGIRHFENGTSYETVKRCLADLGIVYARTL
ncbi:MAG: polysaccharide deacetylase family protein, partial [Clostridia bacterium]|nr:polysaccharide deacetylase family protein [Clostridia bacterium]